MPDLFLTIRNDFAELPAVAAATSQFLEAGKTSSDVIFAANLVIEEIVTNTIKYAYRDSLPHDISIHLALTESALEIEIEDDGQAFDPFIQPGPDLCLPGQAPKIGGLGIHFVRHMVDACSYERGEGRNIVRLTKRR